MENRKWPQPHARGRPRPGGPAPPRRVPLTGSVERKGQVGGGGRLSPERQPCHARRRGSGPGASARMPEGRAAAVPFGFPAGLEAGACLASACWPAPRPPQLLLAPWLLNPSAQCSRPAWTWTRKKAARPHRRLSVGGVPFADRALLGGPLRGSGSENVTQVVRVWLLVSLLSLLQVKKPHPLEGSAPHLCGALRLPCPWAWWESWSPLEVPEAGCVFS